MTQHPEHAENTALNSPERAETPQTPSAQTKEHWQQRWRQRWQSGQRWIMALARRKSAPYWLGMISFAESIAFPIPVDPMLIVMVLAKPERFITFAMIAALTSTLGGVVGWYLGVHIGEAMLALLSALGQQDALDSTHAAFARYGWILILIGSFTPLPYKLTVIIGGSLGVGLAPLVIASLIGRTSRFTLVAAIIRYRSDRRIATTLVTALLVLIAIGWWMLTP